MVAAGETDYNVTMAIEDGVGGATIYALPSAAFSMYAVIDNPDAEDVTEHAIELNFDTNYFTVDSVNLIDFPSNFGTTINNVTGTVTSDPYFGPPAKTNAVAITSVRIDCTAKALEGVSSVSWVYTNGPPPRKAKVIGGPIGEDMTGGNMSKMFDGTVIVGSPKLTVDVSPAGMGQVKVDGVKPGSYPDVSSWGWNDVVDLEAVEPAGGWAFDSWSGDLGGSVNPTSITMDSLAKSVTANFIELDPAIGLSVSDLSFTTYAGVNPADQTFDITNIGGKTLCWALEPPDWSVGDNWTYMNTYDEAPPGTPFPNPYWSGLVPCLENNTLLEVAVTGEDADNYYAVADWPLADPQRTINATDVYGPGAYLPCCLQDASVVIDKCTLDYVSQLANLTAYMGGAIPGQAFVSWVYDSCHGWPYYAGKAWFYNVTVVDAVHPGGKTTAAQAMVTAGPVTFGGFTDCYVITHATPNMAGTVFMQQYWSDTARNFVYQWDGGTFAAPPLDQRIYVTQSPGPAAPPALPDWLSVSPTNGALVGNGDSQTVTVSVDAAGANLTVGDYNATITVTGGSSETVAVSLTVKPATYIPSMRDLPGNAMDYDQAYPGAVIDVYVNFTASADGLNSIGLTDAAPDGWMVQVDKTWCTPNAYAVQAWGNEAEILWAGPYNVGDNFSAMYKVTVPVTATPGINTWEVCPDMNEAWLEYYFGLDGPHKACISGEYQLIVTVPGDVIGETRDVNAAPLGDVEVTLLKQGVGALVSDASTPNYSNTAVTTGTYWQVATKALYYTINMTGMTMLPPNPIDLSTPALLAAGKVFDFEGNYGLVPRACDMWYAQKSVNLWLFPPALEYDIYMNVINDWGIDEWKALDSIHSWQFPS